MPVEHAFVSAKSDGGDATLVRPSDWNADHVQKYAPGSFTVVTEQYAIFAGQVILGATDTATIEGTGQVSVIS